MALNNNENSNECHQTKDTFGSVQIPTLRKVIPVNQHGLKCSFELYSKDVKDLQRLVILQLIKKKKKKTGSGKYCLPKLTRNIKCYFAFDL